MCASKRGNEMNIGEFYSLPFKWLFKRPFIWNCGYEVFEEDFCEWWNLQDFKSCEVAGQLKGITYQDYEDSFEVIEKLMHES